MSYFLDKAKNIEETIRKDRRTLHQNPEVYDDLPMTANYIKTRLKEMGIESKEISKCGIVAEIGGFKKGKCILLRADMDALPMKEESGLPYTSINDYAHTCGHDLHAAGLLGAAKLLKEHEKEINGTVRLMFQPDEEGLTGAKAMIEAGVLDGVDVAMASHVFPGALKPGYVATHSGYTMASSDRFSIHITGHGSHGSAPHKSIDPINTGVHIYLGLQEIIAREADATDPLVITLGSFRAGDAPNIIPETAVLEGSIRAKTAEGRALAKRRLVEISKGVAKTYGSKCEVTFLGGTSPLYNDPELLDEMSLYLKDITEGIVNLDFQMGSEDFALIAEKVPAVYIAVGAGGEEECYNLYYNHNPKVMFSEDSLVYISAMFAHCATKWLDNQA